MHEIAQKAVAFALVVAAVLITVRLAGDVTDSGSDHVVMDDSGILENRVAALEAALADALADKQVANDTNKTLRLLRKRLKTLEAQLADAPAGKRGRRGAGGKKRKKTPRYVSLVSPYPKLEVSQKPDGSLLIQNRDPSLTGRLVTVKATLPGGRVRQLKIGVPRPR